MNQTTCLRTHSSVLRRRSQVLTATCSVHFLRQLQFRNIENILRIKFFYHSVEILCSSAFRALRDARLVTSTPGVTFVQNLALKKGVPTAQFLKKHSVPSITSNVRSYNSRYHRMYSPQTSSINDCLKTMPPVGGWTISPLKREIVPL